MKNANATTVMIVGCVLFCGAARVSAQDWPQWRGPNRDAKVTGFKAPKTWPKELTQKWKVTVGKGVGTPALVGDKLYVFTLEDGNEVTRCLDAANGKELWTDKYEAKAVTGFAAGRNGEFAGPRSSPTVVDGKVVTLGLQGTLSCLDAGTGKKLWRKNDFKGALPRFSTASSPIVVDGLCIAQLGSSSKGAIVAYDLASGDEKWKWAGDGTAYASPVLLSLGGAKVIVAETEQNIVAVAGGKLLWKTAFAPAGGRGRAYNACTPMVDGQTIFFSGKGRGTKAVKLEKKGDEIAAKEFWNNKENGVQFNTPVLKNGLLFGISESDKLFCINADNGKTAWTSPGGGSGGYGSILDVGPVLIALNPTSQLTVFESSDKEFKEVAKYKLTAKETYAYPIIAGNRIFIKDRDSITLWTIE
jgi:outer membrane protein assembly factor BamB